MQCFTLTAIITAEKHTFDADLTKSMGDEIKVKDNHYSMFHPRSYHCCREMHFNSILDVKY